MTPILLKARRDRPKTSATAAALTCHSGKPNSTPAARYAPASTEARMNGYADEHMRKMPDEVGVARIAFNMPTGWPPVIACEKQTKQVVMYALTASPTRMNGNDA